MCCQISKLYNSDLSFKLLIDYFVEIQLYIDRDLIDLFLLLHKNYLFVVLAALMLPLMGTFIWYQL